MPDKNHNNTPGWRDRLEHLEHFQGFTPFNKDAAWDKLENRLEQPASKNKKAWLWIAAALLTGVLVAVTWFNQEKKSTRIIVAQPAISQEKLTQKELVIAKAGDQLSTQQKEKVKPAIRIPSNNKQPGYTTQEKEITPALPSPAPAQEPGIIFTNNIDSPTLALQPTSLTRKKMPVVYLNEIEAVDNFQQNNRANVKKQRTRYQKFSQTGGDDIYVSSQPARLTITISSAN